MLINDGGGSGRAAEVNADRMVLAASVCKDIAAWKALNGRLFLVNTGILSVTTTEGLMAWLYYGSTTKYLAIANMSVTWNGGDTNADKHLEITYHAGDTQPDTNISVGTIKNANTASQLTLEGSSLLLWNGTGTGMTGHTEGSEISESVAMPATSETLINGKMIVGPKTSLSLYAKGAEAGKMAFTGWFFEYDPEELEI